MNVSAACNAHLTVNDFIDIIIIHGEKYKLQSTINHKHEERLYTVLLIKYSFKLSHFKLIYNPTLIYTENILKNENTACRKSDFALQGTSRKPEIRSLKAGVGSLDWGRMKIF
jgi:hypothetical protein